MKSKQQPVLSLVMTKAAQGGDGFSKPMMGLSVTMQQEPFFQDVGCWGRLLLVSVST